MAATPGWGGWGVGGMQMHTRSMRQLQQRLQRQRMKRQRVRRLCQHRCTGDSRVAASAAWSLRLPTGGGGGTVAAGGRHVAGILPAGR